MKVLYIEHYAGSEGMGMEFRPYYVATELMKRGHQVLILAADYSHLRRKNPEVGRDFEVQTIEGVDYMFLKTGTYEGNGLSRFQTMLTFVGKIIKNPEKVLSVMKPDAIICSSTYPLDTFAGQRLAKHSGARLYHEIHDLWPLSPMVLGNMSKYHPFILLMAQAEKSAYKKSKKIISILPNTAPYVRSLGLSTPVVVVPNGLPAKYFEESFAPDPSVLALVNELHAKGSKIIAYAGGLSVSNAMDVFLRSLEHLKPENISAIIIGKGIEKDKLREQAKASGLTEVHFVDPIAKDSVIASLSLMDALYIGGTSSEIYQYGVSMNKIYDYLMSGSVIVDALGIEHSDLRTCGSAISVPHDDPKAIAEGILCALSKSESERLEIRQAQTKFVRDCFNYERIGKLFEQAISN